MRKPKIKEIERRPAEVTYCISKKDLAVKNVEIKIKDVKGEVIETRLLAKDQISEWIFTMSEEELRGGTSIYVTDYGGDVISFNISS